MCRLLLYIQFLFLLPCLAVAQTIQSTDDSLLLQLLSGKDPMLDEVLLHPEKYQFQLLYTQIEEKEGRTVLNTRNLYQNKYYFNPASLIKLPLAAISLEKLTMLYDSGIDIHSHFFLNTCSCDKASDIYVNNQQNPTFLQLMREMLIMSDNDAYNVFFDFVGKDLFNERMRQMGYSGTLLKRRFTSNCSDSLNNVFGGLLFETKDSGSFYQVGCDTAKLKFTLDAALPVTAGVRYLEKGKIIDGPKDFSTTNYFSLVDAHRFLLQLFYPSVNQLDLQMKSVYMQLLKEALADFPRALKSKAYPVGKYKDDYYKFFLDSHKFNTVDGSIKIYSKVGMASGFISDVAYFTDATTGVHFFLSAAMLAKKSGAINDGKYDYYDFGIPVFRKIANLIYDFELRGKK